MPNHDHVLQVARSVRRDLDRDGNAFTTIDRMELTRRLRSVSQESQTRLKAALGADLERALSDLGLRCYPHLHETSTPDAIRIFRAGSVVSDLIDAVLVPSPDHDRELATAVAKVKGKWDWGRETDELDEASAATLLGRMLSREAHLEFVRSIDDPDLATT